MATIQDFLRSLGIGGGALNNTSTDSSTSNDLLTRHNLLRPRLSPVTRVQPFLGNQNFIHGLLPTPNVAPLRSNISLEPETVRLLSQRNNPIFPGFLPSNINNRRIV